MKTNSKTIDKILYEFSKEFLENLYWKEDKTTREVAVFIGTSQPTVRKLFRQIGIKIKNKYVDYDGPMTGRKFTEEHKEKISNKMIGNKNGIDPLTGKSKNFNQIIVNCSECNKEILLSPSRINKCKNHFCNPECEKIFKSRIVGSLNKNFRSIFQKCDNDTCNNQVKINPNMIKRSKTGKFFCCFKCNGEWKSKNLVGDKVYNFLDGTSSDRYYGPRWNFIKKEVRKRDNYTCQNCGVVPNKSLDVHHIIPWRHFVKEDNTVNYEKANCFDLIGDNLISYCNKCHTKIEAETNQILDIMKEKIVKALYIGK